MPLGEFSMWKQMFQSVYEMRFIELVRIGRHFAGQMH